MQGKLEDGSYTAEVMLTGGSGRSGIQSPANLHIENNEITAEIIWSSPNYDYMEVGGNAYYPLNSEGNSVFKIAVPALDRDIPVLAETVAMSEPHMIEYTIKFDSSTLKPTDAPVMFIWYISAAVILAASIFIAAFAAKRKKKKHEKIN